MQCAYIQWMLRTSAGTAIGYHLFDSLGTLGISD
jgi:hypothetical protein